MGGILAFVAIGAAVSFGPIVRSRVAKEAARRSLEIDVGAVRPGVFAVLLKDVRVKPRGVAGVEARVEQIRVDLTPGFSVRDVTLRGGEIRVDGEPEDVVDRLRAFQHGGGGGAPVEGSRRVGLAAEGIALAWKIPSGGELTAAGIKVSRTDTSLKAGCERFFASRDRTTVEITQGDVELGIDASFQRAVAATVTVAHVPARAVAPTAPAAPPSSDPAPPPLPAPVAKGKGKAPRPAPAKATTAPAADAGDNDPVLPLPDLHALRARLDVVTNAIAARLPDGAKIEVGGLSLKGEIGGEAVSFGPAPFTLAHTGDLIHVSYASDAKAKDAAPPATPDGARAGTPLSIDADLPLGIGDATARLSGGPVALATLGVKEGMKGLSGVARTTLSGKGQIVLATSGDALTFDGQVALQGVSIKQPRLSPEPLAGLDFAVSGRGVLDDAGKLRVDDAELDVGALHMRTHGTVEETRDHFALSLATDVTPAACQALLEATPQGLLPTVRSARMSGTFGAHARVVFDTRAIDKMVLEYQIDDRCRIVEVPRDLARDRFTSSFTYRTYHPDGSAGETVTGPGTTTWTALDDISPYMVAAVLTTEDGAFYRHHGFNHAAIKSSVLANLKARRFIRGASTITMQLAKNLFLSRQKTLSRKIEEVLLTNYLEQVFRKDDMMELYLNVIEFGPDVYGITRAAEHYFGRKPEELNVPECFFLASLLPAPVRYGRLRDKGEVPESWGRHIRALMEIASKNGKITRAELTDALAQPVVFIKPGDPRPEPRRAVSTTRRDQDGTDADWQPLE